MKKLLMAVLVVCVIVLVFPSNVAQAQPTQKPKWMSSFAWAVGICETGKGNRFPDFSHDSGTYQGFVGWYHGTWDLDRWPWMANNAANASPRSQYRVFLRSVERGRYYGCIANGGYKYWLRK